MCTASLCAEIVALCADIHRAEYRLIELIRELDRARPWRHDEIPSCAHWLNVHCGLDLVTAREKVRIAHALPGLPLIREAFRMGELSYSKVRAITRVADFLNESELLEMAKSCTAAHVAQRVKTLRQAERLQESSAAYAAYRQRSVICHYDENGSLIFEGRLPADLGAVLMQALDRAVDWLFHDQESYRQRQRPDEAEVMDLPPEVRRADALTVLAERFLSDPPQAEEGLNSADRYQITVHASAEALSDNAVLDPDDPPQVEDGPVLATETVRRLACDSALVRILETGDSEPLDVGRKTRVISPALRRAVKRRDKSCRYPNCLHARFTQVHHIEHWADGGKTCLSNLVLLCRHHHRLLHEGRYYIVKDGAHFIFCRGDGTEIAAGRETPLWALCARANMRLSPASRLPWPEPWRPPTACGRSAATNGRSDGCPRCGAVRRPIAAPLLSEGEIDGAVLTRDLISRGIDTPVSLQTLLHCRDEPRGARVDQQPAAHLIHHVTERDTRVESRRSRASRRRRAWPNVFGQSN